MVLRRRSDRTLLLLAETSAALKRALAGERTWVEQSVLHDSWEFCQANGIPNPEEPYVSYPQRFDEAANKAKLPPVDELLGADND